jgi:diguanylate cyclase (GGDEF)-like protein
VEQQLPRSQIRILVVDDDRLIREMISDALVEGFEITTAPDAETAWVALQDRGFDVVLSDQNMPGMMGTELFMKVLDTFPGIARILMTANDRVRDLVDAVNHAHVHRFLIKPLVMETLPDLVREVLRKVEMAEENKRMATELSIKNQLLGRALSVVELHKDELHLEVDQRTQALKDAMAELENMALRDGLTGLFNHRFFQEALANEVARSDKFDHPTGLLFVDVDKFKEFNDTHGHPAGDKLLEKIARVISDQGDDEKVQWRGRVSDVVARYGGEEFVIILPQTDRAGAAVRAERLRVSVEGYPFEKEASQPGGRLTVSVGVAAYPEDAESAEGLIAAADKMLLLAKRSGRNCIKISGVDDAPEGMVPPEFDQKVSE